MAPGKRSNQPRPRGRKTWYLLGGAVVVVLIVVAGLAALVGSKLSDAKTHLDAASNEATLLKQALQKGDQAGARRALIALQSNAVAAESSLSNPLVRASAKTPVYGKNIKAVRTISNALDSVAQDALPPVVNVAGKFNSKTFNPKGGKVDVAAISTLKTALGHADVVLASANADVQGVDTSGLISKVRGPVEKAQAKIQDATTLVSRGSVAANVLPTMLGAHGSKTYLLLFQNNAEIRSTGGLPGAWAILHVDDGKITLGTQGSATEISSFGHQVVPLTAEEKYLFDTKLSSDFRDLNFTPDFPRVAQIATAMIKQYNGTTVDGVLSVDPVTLGYILKGTGPVTLEDSTTLNSSNAVDTLLNQVYVTYPKNKEQDAFFASAAQKIFDKVASGAGNPQETLRALTRGTTEGRVYAWSKDASVQKQLAATQIGGALPIGKTARPAIGVYFDDATGAKMDYYLRYDVNAVATKCSSTGQQTYSTKVTFRSQAPADSTTLPESIQGPGFGAFPGSFLVNTYIYSPDGGRISKMTLNGKKTTYFNSKYLGRGVTYITVEMDPGKPVTLLATMTSGKNQRGSTKVSVTPSVVAGSKNSVVASACH